MRSFQAKTRLVGTYKTLNKNNYSSPGVLIEDLQAWIVLNYNLIIHIELTKLKNIKRE